MKKFIQRAIFLGTPIVLLLLGYVVFDPFRILYSYENIYQDTPVIPNRDYVSSETFLNTYADKGYDSYILGSSRSLSFYPEVWKQYLPQGARTFIFDASGESIFGISKKMETIDKVGAKIKNVLIIIDVDGTFKRTSDHTESVIGIKHPKVAGTSVFGFHSMALKSYLFPQFWSSYYAYKFFGVKLPYSTEYLETRSFGVNKETNKLTIKERETEITNTPKAYYEKRANIFFTRKPNIKPNYESGLPVKALELAKNIKQILDKHKASYKLVIAPLYDQQQFSEKAKSELSNIFGKSNIYDFSGVNEFTDDKYNYYETSHFRPHVADSIMRRIYQ